MSDDMFKNTGYDKTIKKLLIREGFLKRDRDGTMICANIDEVLVMCGVNNYSKFSKDDGDFTCDIKLYVAIVSNIAAGVESLNIRYVAAKINAGAKGQYSSEFLAKLMKKPRVAVMRGVISPPTQFGLDLRPDDKQFIGAPFDEDIPIALTEIILRPNSRDEIFGAVNYRCGAFNGCQLQGNQSEKPDKYLFGKICLLVYKEKKERMNQMEFEEGKMYVLAGIRPVIKKENNDWRMEDGRMCYSISGFFRIEDAAEHEHFTKEYLALNEQMSSLVSVSQPKKVLLSSEWD